MAFCGRTAHLAEQHLHLISDTTTPPAFRLVPHARVFFFSPPILSLSAQLFLSRDNSVFSTLLVSLEELSLSLPPFVSGGTALWSPSLFPTSLFSLHWLRMNRRFFLPFPSGVDAASLFRFPFSSTLSSASNRESPPFFVFLILPPPRDIV